MKENTDEKRGRKKAMPQGMVVEEKRQSSCICNSNVDPLNSVLLMVFFFVAYLALTMGTRELKKNERKATSASIVDTDTLIQLYCFLRPSLPYQ